METLKKYFFNKISDVRGYKEPWRQKKEKISRLAGGEVWGKSPLAGRFFTTNATWETFN